MRLVKYICFTSLVCLLFSSITSCSTDLEVGGNYEETTIVFGLLDSKQDTQFVSIKRGYFNSEGSASTYIHNVDSIFFDTTELSVSIEEFENGVSIRTIDLKPITLDQINPLSAHPNDIIYYTTNSIAEENTYKLTIENKRTNQTVSATSSALANDLTLISPNSNALITFSDENASDNQLIEWGLPEIGEMFDLEVEFFYNEYDTPVVNEFWSDFRSRSTLGVGRLNVSPSFNLRHKVGETKSISIPVFNSKLRKEFTEKMDYQFPTSNFYSKVGNLVELPAAGNFLFPVYAIYKMSYAGPDLTNYITINNAQSGLASGTVTPSYSNINNGAGIFSSRTTSSHVRYFYNYTSGISLFEEIPRQDTSFDAWGNPVITNYVDTVWADDLDSLHNSQAPANNAGVKMYFSSTLEDLQDNPATDHINFATH